MKKVFLGGTWNDSKWRGELIPKLKINYFNPVVEDRNAKTQANELKERQECDFCLYVIASFMTGVSAMAEAVQDSCRRPEKTLFCVLQEDDCGIKFKPGQSESLLMVSKMIEQNGAKVFLSLDEIAEYLNQFYVEIPYDPNLIECLIGRDGSTEVNLHKQSYIFEENELGDCVCEVLSGDHRKYLLSLPDFRIYQENEAPKKEFTDEEENFKQKWERLGADMFLAYVNGHIVQFNDSNSKIRNMACKKWQTLLPHMGCPILAEEEVSEEISSQEPFNTEAELSSFDFDFWRQWKAVNGVTFKKYVKENDQQFLDAPEFLWNKAMEKWKKLITDKTGESWPFETFEDKN